MASISDWAAPRVTPGFSRPTTVSQNDPRELSSLFAACGVHQTVYRLAFAKAWRLPPARVAQWVAEAWEWVERV